MDELILDPTPRNIERTFADPKVNLRCNLRVLGSQLGLDGFKLDEIELLPFSQRRVKILDECSKTLQGLSWSLLVSVLRKPSLKEYSAADYIEHYLKSPTSDFRSTSPQQSLPTSTLSLETQSTPHSESAG